MSSRSRFLRRLSPGLLSVVLGQAPQGNRQLLCNLDQCAASREHRRRGSCIHESLRFHERREATSLVLKPIQLSVAERAAAQPTFVEQALTSHLFGYNNSILHRS